MCGEQAITYAEIEAFGRVMGVRITPHEADILRGLDRLYRRVVT